MRPCARQRPRRARSARARSFRRPLPILQEHRLWRRLILPLRPDTAPRRVSCSVHVFRVRCRAANGRLGGLVPSRPHGPPPCPSGNVRSCRVAAGRACSPPVASARARLPRGERSLPPPRPPRSSSPRSALAGASPAQPPRRPARCCMRPPPAHRAAARARVEMPHITPSAPHRGESRRSTTASRPPPPGRLDPVADRRV